MEGEEEEEEGDSHILPGILQVCWLNNLLWRGVVWWLGEWWLMLYIVILQANCPRLCQLLHWVSGKSNWGAPSPVSGRSSVEKTEAGGGAGGPSLPPSLLTSRPADTNHSFTGFYFSLIILPSSHPFLSRLHPGRGGEAGYYRVLSFIWRYSLVYSIMLSNFLIFWQSLYCWETERGSPEV